MTIIYFFSQFEDSTIPDTDEGMNLHVYANMHIQLIFQFSGHLVQWFIILFKKMFLSTGIEDVLNSRNFKMMGNAGPSLMARSLVKRLYTGQELDAGYLNKEFGKKLDEIRMKKIKGLYCKSTLRPNKIYISFPWEPPPTG